MPIEHRGHRSQTKLATSKEPSGLTVFVLLGQTLREQPTFGNDSGTAYESARIFHVIIFSGQPTAQSQVPPSPRSAEALTKASL